MGSEPESHNTRPSVEDLVNQLEVINRRAPRPIDLLSGHDAIVKVVVGSDTPESTWHLHRSLAIKRSPFFRGALCSDFEESHTNKVDLPEDDNQAFAVFVQWLYSTLHETKFNQESFSSDLKVDTLVKAYYLAVKLMADPLSEAIMIKLYNDSRLCEELLPDTLQYAWDSQTDAPLTELLLDTVSCGIMNRRILIMVGPNDIHSKRAREWKDLARRGGDLIVELLSRIGADSLGKGIRPLSSYLGISEHEVKDLPAPAAMPVSWDDMEEIREPEDATVQVVDERKSLKSLISAREAKKGKGKSGFGL